MTAATHEPGPDETPADVPTDTCADAPADAAAEGPDRAADSREQVRARMAEALARKQGREAPRASGPGGDRTAPGTHGPAATRRQFRRKSG